MMIVSSDAIVHNESREVLLFRVYVVNCTVFCDIVYILSDIALCYCTITWPSIRFGARSTVT